MVDLRTAYMRAEAAFLRGDRMRVFDWATAAQIIKAEKPDCAYAGLAEDWGCTSAVIYTADGIPERHDNYLYAASIWAIPQILLVNDDSQEHIDCWKYGDETPGWNYGTYWPQEALDILVNKTKR